MPSNKRIEGSAGWTLVAVAALAHFFGLASISTHAFGVFVLPLQHQFGWTRGQIAFANTIMMVTLIVSAPIAGALADRFGTKPLVLGSTLFMGVALACMAYMATIDEFYLAYLLIGTLGVGTIGPIYVRLIFSWFKTKKGLALGLVMGGGSASAIILPPALNALISAEGWRVAYGCLAACEILVICPLILWGIRSYPASTQEGHAQLAAATGDQDVDGVSFGDALKSPIFYMLCMLFFVLAIGQSVYIHIIPLVVDKGISPATAALAASVLGVTTLIARLLTGLSLDYFRIRVVAIILLTFSALGMLVLMISNSVPGVFLGAMLVGVIYGGEADVMGFFVITYFGRRAYARLHTTVFSAYVGGGAVGVMLTGSLFDRFHDYTIPLQIGVGCALFAIVVIWTFDRSGKRELSNTRPVRLGQPEAA